MQTEYFESAEVSDVGRKRKNNEDACLRIPEHGFFCVADGMGGQAGGDLASEAITTNLQQAFTGAAMDAVDTLAKRIALVTHATNQASKWIKKFSDEKVLGQMGSTMVALVIDPQSPTRAAALHAGDSRLYRYRQSQLKQITADHSAIALLAAKLGRPAESLPAKYQNELLRAVGLNETVELEQTLIDIASGDTFLICSDGLTKMQSDEQIAAILRESGNEPVAAVAKKLIDTANDAGGRDNITVVLVKARDLSQAPKPGDSNEDEELTRVAPSQPLPIPVPILQAPSSSPQNSETPLTKTDMSEGETMVSPPAQPPDTAATCPAEITPKERQNQRPP
jgi:protein phosphatase